MIGSYLTSKAFSAPTSDCGLGVFARELISKEERLAVFGGHVIGIDEFFGLSQKCQDCSFQIAEDLMFALLSKSELGSAADLFNHSCDPNAGWSGMIELVAMRAILPSEQIRFDYATCLAFDFGSMTCRCGAHKCRGKVTGDDWRDPVVQKANDGYFQPFLTARIKRNQESGIRNQESGIRKVSYERNGAGVIAISGSRQNPYCSPTALGIRFTTKPMFPNG